MSELVRELGGWGLPQGRHAVNEDAVLTPIFHALARGGWRGRQPEQAPHYHRADPVDEFRRDPLTAPIPVQALEPRRPVLAEGGRHHLAYR